MSALWVIPYNQSANSKEKVLDKDVIGKFPALGLSIESMRDWGGGGRRGRLSSTSIRGVGCIG
jgi:hypothetical protein